MNSWWCQLWDMLIHHDISEWVNVIGRSLHVVCVCCACGAAFTEAYGGFAYWAKSWLSYLAHFVISNAVIADFQSRLFSSDRETFPSSQWVHPDFPSELRAAPPPRWHTRNTHRNTWTRRDRETHSCVPSVHAKAEGEIIDFYWTHYRTQCFSGGCRGLIILYAKNTVAFTASAGGYIKFFT